MKVTDRHWDALNAITKLGVLPTRNPNTLNEAVEILAIAFPSQFIEQPASEQYIPEGHHIVTDADGERFVKNEASEPGGVEKADMDFCSQCYRHREIIEKQSAELSELRAKCEKLEAEKQELYRIAGIEAISTRETLEAADKDAKELRAKCADLEKRRVAIQRRFDDQVVKGEKLEAFIRKHERVTYSNGAGCSSCPHCIACGETTNSYGGRGHTEDCELVSALAQPVAEKT